MRSTLDTICKTIRKDAMSSYKPMHASSLNHHSKSNSSIHQASMNIEFKTCNATIHYVNAHTNATNSPWACSPYLCAQILIDPPPLSKTYFSPLSYTSPLCIFVTYFSPFVNNHQKGVGHGEPSQSILVGIKLIKEWIKLWFNLDHLPKYVIRFEPRTSFFTPHKV
jgi:hypothetical protein